MDDAIRAFLLNERENHMNRIDRIDELLIEPATEEDLFGHRVSSDKPKREGKPPVEKSMPHGLMRIRRMFNCRDTTPAADKERKSYNSLAKRLGKDELYEQIGVMEKFYKFKKKRAHTETNWWSNDSFTLMNNWDAKYGCAVDFLSDKPSSSSSVIKILKEPDSWRKWAIGHWDGANVPFDWYSIAWPELLKFDSQSQLGICKEIVKNCA